jgi:hypothetical protein
MEGVMFGYDITNENVLVRLVEIFGVREIVETWEPVWVPSGSTFAGKPILRRPNPFEIRADLGDALDDFGGVAINPRTHAAAANVFAACGEEEPYALAGKYDYFLVRHFVIAVIFQAWRRRKGLDRR